LKKNDGVTLMLLQPQTDILQATPPFPVSMSRSKTWTYSSNVLNLCQTERQPDTLRWALPWCRNLHENINKKWDKFQTAIMLQSSYKKKTGDGHNVGRHRMQPWWQYRVSCLESSGARMRWIVIICGNSTLESRMYLLLIIVIRLKVGIILFTLQNIAVNI